MLPIVTTGRNQGTTDLFWQNAVFTPKGTFVVSYYHRILGCHRLCHSQQRHIRSQAGHILVDAGANPVRRAVLR
jgi:hypothetical protein